MNILGTFFLDIVAVAVLIWVLDLTRRGRLYVGYGVIFVVAIVGAMIVISVPPLLEFVTNWLDALSPVPGFTLLVFGFTLVMLVYILTQTTVISNRLAEVVQELAILRMKSSADSPGAESAAREMDEEDRD
jgi:hypothetical protein